MPSLRCQVCWWAKPTLTLPMPLRVQDGADFFVQSLQWRSRQFGGDHKTGKVGQPPPQVLIPEDDEPELLDDAAASDAQAQSPGARSAASVDDEAWERARADSDGESPRFAYRPTTGTLSACCGASVFCWRRQFSYCLPRTAEQEQTSRVWVPVESSVPLLSKEQRSLVSYPSVNACLSFRLVLTNR